MIAEPTEANEMCSPGVRTETGRERSDDTVILAMPRDSWELIHEALQLDRRSGARDRERRRQIGEALDSVVQCDEVVHVSVMVISGLVDEVEVHVHSDGAEAALVEWLSGQPGVPERLSAGEWWAMRETGRAPMDLEDSTIYTVPVQVE